MRCSAHHFVRLLPFRCFMKAAVLGRGSSTRGLSFAEREVFETKFPRSGARERDHCPHSVPGSALRLQRGLARLPAKQLLGLG